MNQSCGSGSQGKVELAKLYGEIVCVKFFQDSQVMKHELVMLESVQSTGVVPTIKGSFSSPCTNIIVMSYHGSRTLRDFLDSRPSAHDVHKILVGISEALEIIHSKQVIHNDLKENNILVENKPERGYNVVLIDFGWACLCGDSPYFHLSMREIKEYPWIAPWLGRAGIANTSSDMYSIGQLCLTISHIYLCPIYKILGKTLTDESSFEHELDRSFGRSKLKDRMKISPGDIRPLLKASSCSKCLEVNSENAFLSQISSFCKRLPRISEPLN